MLVFSLHERLTLGMKKSYPRRHWDSQTVRGYRWYVMAGQGARHPTPHQAHLESPRQVKKPKKVWIDRNQTLSQAHSGSSHAVTHH
ncbi:Uncharacterised protein [Vibrio cholerae]|nr:Uncharacterised protein [Vibrio cholerae]CSB93529.1 Uncharacterised protein [Vibrio cholerae]